MIIFFEDAVQAMPQYPGTPQQPMIQKQAKQGSNGMGLAMGVGGSLLGLGAMGSYALHRQHEAEKAAIMNNIAAVQQKEAANKAQFNQDMQTVKEDRPWIVKAWNSMFGSDDENKGNGSTEQPNTSTEQPSS